MLNKRYYYSMSVNVLEDAFNKEYVYEKSNLEVSGRGDLVIRNTGGSSASEGGMGSGSDVDKEKGELGNNKTAKEDSDDSFDPIGKNIKEKERERDKEDN